MKQDRTVRVKMLAAGDVSFSGRWPERNLTMGTRITLPQNFVEALRRFL
jgi:hypothetical protein